MQFAQLRYVVAIAEERSFTGAADAAGVAQPTVSAAVRGLEGELGTALFVRGRGEVSLTAAGEAFLPWARQALADADRGREEVADLIGLRAGRLAIGATPSLATSRLPPVLGAYHAAYPAIELAVRQAGSRELTTALAEGLVDLALVILGTSEPHGGIQLATLALASEELVLAVAPGHPLADRTSVTPADLRGRELVVPRPGYDLREVTYAACRGAGFEPTIAVEAGEMDGVLALVAVGLGAAVVPTSVVPTSVVPTSVVPTSVVPTSVVPTSVVRTSVVPTSLPARENSARHGPLVALRFTGGTLTRTLGLAERADRPRSAAAEAFVAELIRQMAVPAA